jgi:hypothetical protein
LGLFRFVTKQFCLFRLFQYRFEKPKQTETFCFWFHETNRNKRETDLVSSLFRFEPKIIFVCFEDTLRRTLFSSETRNPQGSMKEWDPRFSCDERDGAEGAGQQGHVLEDSQGRSNVSFL